MLLSLCTDTKSYTLTTPLKYHYNTHNNTCNTITKKLLSDETASILTHESSQQNQESDYLELHQICIHQRYVDLNYQSTLPYHEGDSVEIICDSVSELKQIEFYTSAAATAESPTWKV
jgi:hypothetical protein